MQRRKWRTYFLQQYRTVEIGYLLWLAAHAACFFVATFIPLSLTMLLIGRFALWQLLAFCTLMATMLAATQTFADHYALCPARTTDEAYRVFQSSVMIWLMFAVGAVFFVSHYNSLFLFFVLVWGGIYAAYQHLRAGRRALKPARDDLLPASMSGAESRAYFASSVVDEIVALRKTQFIREAERERWNDEEIRVKAAHYFT